MTFLRFAQSALFLLILRRASSLQLDATFKAKNSSAEIGYCFGADYFVLYRSTQEGYQLLGNSSDANASGATSADLQGRSSFTNEHSLLGLQIANLTSEDSGRYRKECWRNQSLLIEDEHELWVCDREIESEEIVVKESGGAEILCNSTSIGLEGTSIRWYIEMYPRYKVALYLDTNVSLNPLLDELPGTVEVRDGGARLLIDDKVLKGNQRFFCLVFNGASCLSFQIMYPPDNSDSREIFALNGEQVVLPCSADSQDQLWDTPLGKVTASSTNDQHMYVSESDFSLIITNVTSDHTGEYSCMSSMVEVQYWLGLCTKKESTAKVARERETVSVECRLEPDTSPSIKWQRRQTSGQNEVIYDSRDESVAIPTDLNGRLRLSADGSTLTISDLKATDGGEYWCVVLRSSPFLEDDEDFDFDDEEDEEEEDEEDEDEEEEEDDYDYDPDYVYQPPNCISKQVTTLTVKGSRMLTPPAPEDIHTPPSSDSSSNVAGIAAGVGVAGVLLLVGAIVGAMVLRKRSRASAKPREGAPRLAQHSKADIQVQRDPGCAERLTAYDDVA
ncbi:unnamed protein product [Ophioblennius macclurei]